MFSKTPEALDAVDVVTMTRREFIVTMIHTEMFFITEVNETIVAAPTICVNHAFNVRLASDNRLQRLCFCVWHNLCVYFSIALVKAKNNGFATRATTAFPFYPTWAKVALICFKFALLRESGLTVFQNANTDFAKNTVYGI